MKTRLAFVIGAAAGYVVGSRAGRQGYEKLKKQAAEVWQNPKVQKTVSNVEDFAKEKSPAVGDAIHDVRSKVDDSARGASGTHLASASSDDYSPSDFGSTDSTSSEGSNTEATPGNV